MDKVDKSPIPVIFKKPLWFYTKDWPKAIDLAQDRARKTGVKQRVEIKNGLLKVDSQ